MMALIMRIMAPKQNTPVMYTNIFINLIARSCSFITHGLSAKNHLSGVVKLPAINVAIWFGSLSKTTPSTKNIMSVIAVIKSMFANYLLLISSDNLVSADCSCDNKLDNELVEDWVDDTLVLLLVLKLFALLDIG